MRPAGGGAQPIETTQPSPSNYVGFNNPFFGAPIAFAQCPNTSGMDTTTTVPIYNIPKDSSIGIDQLAVPTVFASGVSPDSIAWSTAEDIIRDIVREGPFDVGATPMETEDSPLMNTSMPGFPYRMTSYRGTAMVDADTRYGLQLHDPRFLEFMGAPESARLFESFTIVLGGQIRTRKCYGGSRKLTEGRWFYDVESSNSGTVRNVVASDVSGNVEYWCGSCGVSGGRSRQAVGNAEGSASSQVHASDGPVAPLRRVRVLPGRCRRRPALPV